MTRSKPRTAQQLVARLKAAQGDLGKGGRRLAAQMIENPGATALLSSGELAARCGVHASSVVRLAQGLGFTGYRELQSLLQRDLSASLNEASPDGADFPDVSEATEPLRLFLLGESGSSFNEAAAEAARSYSARDQATFISTELQVSHLVEPVDLARRIEKASEGADGILLVAREHPAINRAVRAVVGRGTPVICLTSDLPSSGRTAYVGSDQYVSGSMAGWFCGRFLANGAAGQVLFVYSVPFRCQLDREQGFRQVLRSEFPLLHIDERVSSDESINVIYDAVRRYVAKSGPPAAIYNVSGANLGIGRALEAEGLSGTTVFIGHELNANSRSLLEKGVMDLAIGHDFAEEISMAVDCVRMARRGAAPASHITQSQIYTRHNCALF